MKMNNKQVGKKFDHGKPKGELIPPLAIEEVVKVLTFGAEKYSPDNWRMIKDIPSRYQGAQWRHNNAWCKGEVNDKETNLHHLAHQICCLMFILENELITQKENE